MADITATMRALVEALRGGGYTDAAGNHTYGPASQSPLNRNRKPPPTNQPGVMPVKMRGYQLYKAQSQIEGTPTLSYEEWLAQEG